MTFKTSTAILLASCAILAPAWAKTNSYAVDVAFRCNDVTVTTSVVQGWTFVTPSEWSGLDGDKPSCGGSPGAGQTTHYLRGSTLPSGEGTTYIQCYGNGEASGSTGTCCSSGAVYISQEPGMRMHNCKLSP